MSIAALWEKVKEKFGHADVLINNAGVGPFGMLADTPADEWWSNFEINVRGTFLNTRGILKLLGKEKKGSVVNVISGIALTLTAIQTTSGYSLSKLVVLQIQAYVAAEHPNVTAIALHPGIIKTDVTAPMFEPFAEDTPELVGGVGVWLSTEKAAFLNGKYIESNWSVDDLEARKDEIVSEGKLSLVMKGEFGKQQFE